MKKEEEDIRNSPEDNHSGSEAHVRNFKIRPSHDEDDRISVNAFVLMGGRSGTYYIRVTSDAVDRNCHHVEITRCDGDVVDAFEFRFPGTAPDGHMEAVQVIHETYIGPVQDWYDYAVSVEKAGESE